MIETTITTVVVEDGKLVEVVTGDQGTVIRTNLGPAPVDRFAAFADALTASLADENLSAKDAMQQALDIVQGS